MSGLLRLDGSLGCVLEYREPFVLYSEVIVDEIRKDLVPKFFKLPHPLPQEGGEILEQACAKASTEMKCGVLDTLSSMRRMDDKVP